MLSQSTLQTSNSKAPNLCRREEATRGAQHLCRFVCQTLEEDPQILCECNGREENLTVAFIAINVFCCCGRGNWGTPPTLNQGSILYVHICRRSNSLGFAAIPFHRDYPFPVFSCLCPFRKKKDLFCVGA